MTKEKLLIIVYCFQKPEFLSLKYMDGIFFPVYKIMLGTATLLLFLVVLGVA